jgi:uncharacterized protein involved in exopolysaccharide biosynthesis
MGNLQTIGDVIGFLRRRALVIVALTLVGCVLTVLYLMGQPRSYTATAVIQVESPRVADPVAREVAGGPTSFRIQIIEQQIMTREALLALMRRHGIEAQLGGLTEAQRVSILRNAIRIETVQPGPVVSSGTDVSALVISVTFDDPGMAATLANDIADQIIALGSAREIARIDEARAFFTAEEARIAAEIVALEAEVTRFKIDNVDALPESLGPRREEASRLDEALRTLATRRIELEAQRDALLAQPNLRTVGQRQVDVLNGQLALIAEQSTALQTRRAEIDAAFARAPGIEQALSSYARALQQLAERYAVTTRRLAEAETSRALAQNQQTEQLSMLERADPPVFPDGTGRRRQAAIGGAGALLFGLAVALALEFANPVLRTAGQMERAVGLRPVVSIPYIPTPRERLQRRMIRVAGIAAAAVVVVAVLAVAGVYALRA